MTKQMILKTANEAKVKFAFYGFLSCPLTMRELVSLIMRGFTVEQIINFGSER